MKTNLEMNVELITTAEMRNINGGGPGFTWLGKVVGWYNKICNEAVSNGYEHAGLFY